MSKHERRLPLESGGESRIPGRVSASGAKLSAADGVYGDPTRSTAKLGALGVDAIVEQTVAAIGAAVARPK